MMKMWAKIYYIIKPVVPRALQIFLRRAYVRMMRRKYEHVWPVDLRSASCPPGWSGWPENKKFALVITHDVDTNRGYDRCLKLAELEKEKGFRSSFYFVAKRYDVEPELREKLREEGFGVGIHGLYHDGKKFISRRVFTKRAKEINRFLREWNATGFSSPSMIRNLDWIHDLDIEYDLSTFDTDPFEPQPDGVGTIFPFKVRNSLNGSEYIELPYTLPQDFTLFVLMRETNLNVWKTKLDWIAENGGMALINVHPDYMNFDDLPENDEYPAGHYRGFLDYIKDRYEGQYWHVLPEEMARYWKGQTFENMVKNDDKQN